MIEKLKAEVIEKYGSQLLYTKDCKVLADKITVAAGSRISTTTIRRLFGFLKSTSSPAKFTLNILSVYVGCSSWDDFCSCHENIPQEIEKDKLSWSELYEKTLSLSKETYKLVASQSGINFKAVVSRNHAEKRIDSFLKSTKMATSFVAPGGFGKSSMLAKWFENNWIKKQSKDAVLFLNASFMISFINNDFRLDRWIQDQLDFEQKDTLKYFLENPSECEGRIILVIDALDEITYESIKLERLFLQLKQFISNYRDSGRVKLIITSRNSTWEKFALPFVIKGNAIQSSWYQLNIKVNEDSCQSLFPLENKEIQEVFNRTLNSNFSSKLMVGELSYRQKKMISNPFFLELFIKLYNPSKQYAFNEGQQLLNEFLKNKVFYSRYSDEKMDLLYGILKLIKHGKNGTSAKKMELRKLFPIHLKTAGNYFFAYEELVSYGILSEYIATNEHVSYCKYVKITNEQLFETLIGMDLVEKNGGVDFNLIKSVETEYADYEIKNRLISFLYTSAFFNGNHLELKNFFQLNDDTLSDPEVMEAVLNSSLHLNEHSLGLMEHFAGVRRAEVYLFRNFPDLYNLSNGNKVILELFAEKGLSRNVRIKSLSILLLNSIFSLDMEKSEEYYRNLQILDTDNSCTGFAISIRLASILLYNHFVKDETNEIEVLKMFYYREMAYNQFDRDNGDLNGEFELILCMVLIYMKSYHKVLQLIDDVEHIYKKSNSKKFQLNYKLLQCYKYSAQHSLGMRITNSQKIFLESCENEVGASKNYFLQIYYHSFLSSVNFVDGQRDEVERHFNAALELCDQSNYGLCAAGVLRRMAKYYNIWGEKTKEDICIKEEEEILSNALPVFDPETLFI